jgi:tetratricopeptide (TPR) repeat protein
MAAFEAYEAGDYDISTASFQALLAADEDPDIRFYLAMSLQNRGQYEAALQELKRLEGTSTRFVSQALWYRALLEIRMEQREEASSTLQKLLQAAPAFKAPEARRVLEKL